MNETDVKLGAAEQGGDFSPEQKRYLEGFVAGAQIAKAAKTVAGMAAPGAAASPPEPVGPDAADSRRRTGVLASGGKLSDPEKFKREQHPFDAYDRLKEQAAERRIPKPPDNFRWRYFGLFYVAPDQNSYMCRLRIPNGILTRRAVRRRRRYRRTLRRRLRARDDARQSPDPRNRGERRGRRRSRRSRISACARAAPAPTTSAMSPARRPPESIRRN